MNRSSRCVWIAAIWCWLCVSCLTGQTVACPFCLAPPETWAEILSGADAVLVSQFDQLRTSAHPVRAEADFLIHSLVRSPLDPSTDYAALRFRSFPAALEQAAAAGGRAESGNAGPLSVSAERRLSGPLRAGQIVTIREYVTGQPGDLFLLVGRHVRPLQRGDAGTWAARSPDDRDETGAGSDGVTVASYQVDSERDESAGVPDTSILRAALTVPELLQWDSPTPVNQDLLSYLLDAPDNAVPAALRLRYYVRFLESPHPEIAADAWGEFARSDYTDVVAVRDRFSTQRLRGWIADPEMSPERLGLYGMMLGLCGTDEDAEFLRQQIGVAGTGTGTGTGGFRFGLEGLMGGYLLLRGESALEFLEDTRLKHQQTAADEQFAVLQAIQFLAANEVHRIPPERLRKALYMLLEHGQVREIVITDLARSRDWQATPKLLSMFAEMPADDRSAQAIVQFMQTMLRAEEKSPGDVPAEHQNAARCFLDMVRAEHPRLLLMTQRDFGPPQ